MNFAPIAKKLRDVFFDPNDDISKLSESEIAKIISSSLTGVYVNMIFEDDNVTCFDVNYTVKDKTIRYLHYWIGDLHRLFYHSEVSKPIREGSFAKYLAHEIFEYDD